MQHINSKLCDRDPTITWHLTPKSPVLPSPTPISLVLFTLILDLIYFRQAPKFVLSNCCKFCSDNEQQQWRTCQENMEIWLLDREYEGGLAHRKLLPPRPP